MAGATVRKNDEGDAFWFLGGLYEVLVSADDTDGAATVMRITMSAGTGSPPHKHPGDEAMYVLAGELQVHIGDDVVTAGPGTQLFFPAGTKEWAEATTESTVLVTYTPGGVDRFFAEVGERAPSRTLPPPSDEVPDFERLVAVGATHGLQIEGPAH